MTRYAWIVGVALAAAGVVRAQDKAATAKADPRAAALMEEASKSRYTWSQDATAVSGKFTWEMDGKAGGGTFRSVFHQRGGLKMSAEGSSETPEEVREHIGSMINHRVAPPATAAKKPAPAVVIVVEDEERGPLILTVGDAMQSTQRVRDGKLVQVNRVMGGKRFTIDVTDFEKLSDGRACPAAFTVTWWDAASGKKTEKQTYTTQGFQTVDGQLFPKSERVVSEKDGKTSTLEIHYSDVKFDTSPQRAEAR
jgi:hypothetical protein